MKFNIPLKIFICIFTMSPFFLSAQTGCMDSLACNFNALAEIDDNSLCLYPGCTDPAAFNYDSTLPAGTCTDNSVCEAIVIGCMNPNACDFNPAANTPGSCILPDGCTDSTAFNYDPEAVCNDGSCIAVALGVLTRQHSIMIPLRIQMMDHVLL